jgi:hypothetical protein
MASEQALEILMRRHVFDSERPFASVRQAQGSIGLMRFLQLDCDSVLTLDPQAPDWAGRRLVRLIAGNPVTMGQMTRHVADAGSYARSPSSSRRCPAAEPGSPTTWSPARSLPTTTRRHPRSPDNSTPRCSGSCVSDRVASIPKMKELHHDQ